MNEDLTSAPLKEKIHSVTTVVGTGESFQQKIRILLEQLGGLHCFDDDPEYMEEFKGVIINEVGKGAEKIGLIGSRAEGTQQPGKSDLDVVVINPKVNEIFPKKGLEKVELAGKINYWGSKAIGMAPAPRIHINRYSRRERNNEQVIRNAVWVWVKDDKS